MNPKPIAHVYVRHSTKAQAAGDSHGRQLARAKEWAVKNGHSLMEIYDNGVSGFTGANRTIGQFGAFVERLRGGELGSSPVLLIESFDRLSREDLNRAQVIFLELLNLGATVVTLANGKRYQGKLQLGDTIMAICEMDAAHEYSAKLSDRVSSSVIRRKKEGIILHNAGSCPPWLAIGTDRKSWIILPVEADKVVKIYEMASTGQGSTLISRALMAEKITPLPRTKGWSQNLVQRLLLDRRVLGDFCRKNTTEWIPNYFPPVVEKGLFARVNEGRVIRSRGAGKVAEHNLVRSLCVDPEGRPLIHRTSGSRGRAWSYLAGKGINPFRVPYPPVEATVLYALECLNEDINAIQVRQSDDLFGRITESKERLIGIDRQLGRLKRVLLSVDEPPTTLIAEMKELEAQRQKINASLQAMELARLARLEAPNLKVPTGGNNDLKDPALRRALRAKIALNFKKIVVHNNSLDFYLAGFDVAEKFTLPFVLKDDEQKGEISC